jgi:N-hydroxyarylamine O-acetyltransferase
MNVKAYLQRIGYTGSLNTSIKTLRDLQIAHLLTVPFENLSIHSKQPIILNDKALFDKIVKKKRGGFCYELNGLFACLLRELGFDVVMLSAQVAKDEGGFGPDFDHMTLLVTLDQRWLVDVGFGDNFGEPLLLDNSEVQIQGKRAYRIVEEDAYLLLMERKYGKGWHPQYCFTLKPCNYDDFLEMCHYHQSSPNSHFTQKRICSMATPDGRITLEEKRLIITRNDSERQEKILSSEEEYLTLLRQYFNIE